MNTQNYTDKNGELLEVGDYVFYTERPISNYADSLGIIIDDPENNSIRMKTLVVNHGGKYEAGNFEKNTVEMIYHTFDFHNKKRVTDIEKIKHPLIDTDLVSYMNENYPLT